jgi:hypothetical protein
MQFMRHATPARKEFINNVTRNSHGDYIFITSLRNGIDTCGTKDLALRYRIADKINYRRQLIPTERSIYAATRLNPPNGIAETASPR